MAKAKDGKTEKAPKQQNPWDQPPFPAHGDRDIDITFAAIGRALTAWEIYEQTLSSIFAATIGWRADLLHVVQRAYGSIVTSKGRLEMIEAASDAKFIDHPNPELQRNVNAVLKAAGRYGGRRNEIAHGIVRRFDDGRGKPEYVLYPSTVSTKKFSDITDPNGGIVKGIRRPKYAYSSAEIEAFRLQFVALNRGAQVVWAALVREQQSRQKPRP